METEQRALFDNNKHWTASFRFRAEMLNRKERGQLSHSLWIKTTQVEGEKKTKKWWFYFFPDERENKSVNNFAAAN